MTKTNGNLISTRISPATEKLLESVEAERRMSRSDILRTALDQFLFGEEWISRCDAVLKNSINQVNESHRALEARIERLVDEGAIDFEIQTINTEIAKSEERLKTEIQSFIETRFQAAFERMVHRLPAYIIQLHEQQKGQHQPERRE